MTTYVCIPTTKNDDPNYRYKMPQMKLSQMSRLNGVKTNVTNLPDVARALRVPESAILKYFCVEVGANAEGNTIVKGQHTLPDLERHLNKFIMKYVCCKKCKLPEITHEVNKKNLIGICRSCGNTDSKMDNVHRAGKQLHKDIPNYYAANPEFSTNVAPVQVIDNATPSNTATGQGKKKRRKNQGGAAQQEQVNSEQQEEAKRMTRAADANAEVNILDSINMPLSDPQIQSACEELKTFVDDKLADTGACDVNDILREVRQLQFQLNVTREYKLYIAMCGVFSPNRNIVKHWDTFQSVFTQLVAQEEENGNKHLFQTVCQFFINANPEMQKFAATLCKKLYDNEVLEDSFFIEWHSKKMRMDKDSILFDRKAENAMRGLLAEFVGWLSSAAEYGEEDYGDEEGEESKASAAAKEENKGEATAETDAERAQRELVERQKKAQAEQMEKARAAAAESKSKAAAAQQAEQETATATEENLDKIEQKTKVADIAVDDGFDIDDI